MFMNRYTELRLWCYRTSKLRTFQVKNFPVWNTYCYILRIHHNQSITAMLRMAWIPWKTKMHVYVYEQRNFHSEHSAYTALCRTHTTEFPIAHCGCDEIPLRLKLTVTSAPQWPTTLLYGRTIAAEIYLWNLMWSTVKLRFIDAYRKTMNAGRTVRGLTVFNCCSEKCTEVPFRQFRRKTVSSVTSRL
jgi:hypothetical protein